MVHRRGHLGGDAGIAVAVAVDQRSDARPLGLLAQCEKNRPALQTGPSRIGNEDWVEMIVDPQRVVTPLVGFAPKLGDLVPCDHLLTGLKAKTNRMLAH